MITKPGVAILINGPNVGAFVLAIRLAPEAVPPINYPRGDIWLCEAWEPLKGIINTPETLPQNSVVSNNSYVENFATGEILFIAASRLRPLNDSQKVDATEQTKEVCADER